ncbi:unnamed protein product [Thlaspi arvense]|uniref:non-specific serine/threonine protein kinase n=1 Tax=Thlaspi arvense TaxID=13288 RepID=A0AAU9SKP4_THLAR|nr:unnamed protein product [Thlaspi arvense]
MMLCSQQNQFHQSTNLFFSIQIEKRKAEKGKGRLKTYSSNKISLSLKMTDSSNHFPPEVSQIPLKTIFAVPLKTHSDFHALITLKRGFDFAEQVLVSWNSSNPSSVCSWVGVKCLRGRVVSLDLTDMSLHGSVSPVFSGLDMLTDLSLAGNNFTGEIKVENLSSLRSLNVFDAYNNNFTAPLPIVPGFGGNYFHGKVPEIYGNLIGLEYLSLAGNDLQGRIPGELGNLTSLRKLELGYYNVFEGGIPRELSKLINLVHLDLSMCVLDGSIPAELGDLKSLETLFLHTNLLSGSIPRQLGNLTSLVNLDLSNNAITGEVPIELGNLKELKLLNLFMNRLHGSMPGFVADLPKLETLQLWMNNFTGVIPGSLGRSGSLEVLDLSSNKLTGTIPSSLCDSRRLRILILLKNFLFGSIPESLETCFSLVRVRLGKNYLNGSIPSGFIYLPELNLVELQDNYLSGNLSENGNSTSRPVKLGQLNLSNNLLSGFLPFSLSNFSSLQILLLGETNSLLDLRGNSLSGKIPPEVGNCFHLTFLDLSKNNLSGSIPPEISNIRILNYLNLSRNHLVEAIPNSIGYMKSLTILDLSFNDLSGQLPELGQFAFFNSSSFMNNPQLCGSLLNNPCNVTETRKQPKNNSGEFKIIFALGLLVCSLVFAAAAIIKAKSFKRNNSSSFRMTAFHKPEFTISDVLECMKDGNVIGRGGAGIVYHGKMPNGSEIAVKKLLGFGNNSHDHGFRAEIRTLGNIRHRNIVKLLAFCSNKDTNLLVYEYMRNGKYAYTLRVDEKSDVYSFGVVLLELVTGRRPVGDFGEGVDIVQWAKRATGCRKEEVAQIIDPRLTKLSLEEAMHLFFIAMLCVQENSVERPTMREVVQMLSEKETDCPTVRKDPLV